MDWKRFGLIALIGGLGWSTAACTDGYGYGGASLGYGSGYYADPYYAGGGYGGGYGYGGFGDPFGWNNNFYYPGTGVYVYDRNRRPHRWNDTQRRYWQGRPGWRQNGGRANWNGFTPGYRNERPGVRGDRRDNRPAYRNGRIDRGQVQDGRGDARREYRRDGRQDYNGARRGGPRGSGVEGVRTPQIDRGRVDRSRVDRGRVERRSPPSSARSSPRDNNRPR